MSTIPKDEWIKLAAEELARIQQQPCDQSFIDWATTLAEEEGEDSYYNSGEDPKTAAQTEMSYA